MDLKFLLFFAGLVFWVPKSFAQSVVASQTIRGQVRDQETNRPVEGATVFLEEDYPAIGTVTDKDGFFQLLNVPLGRYTLGIQYLGYEEGRVENLEVIAGKETVVDVLLRTQSMELQEVVINAPTAPDQINPMAQLSGRSFTTEETQRFPVGIGDPARLSTAFAGVLSTDDESNELIIRGNNPRGILWQLEGMEIPSPNHFSAEGASSGGVSMLSTQLLNRSAFYTGAFAPAYGNALSGVFDVRFRNGNAERRAHSFQAGLLGIDLATEGPFQKGGKASYLMNYRYSTLGLLDQLGVSVQKEDETNTYQDLSFKLHLPTKKWGTFSVFGLGGTSRNEEGTIDLLKELETYDMGVIGVSNTLSLGASAFLKSILALSGTRLKDDFLRQQPFVYNQRRDFSKHFERFALKLHQRIFRNHLLEIGWIGSRFGYRFEERVDQQNNSFVRFDDHGISGSQQAYFSWRYRPHKKWTLVSGAHFTHFHLNRQSILEPRLSVRWQFQPNQVLTFGLGQHSRIESLEYYLANPEPDMGAVADPNRDLGLSRATHWVLEYRRDLNRHTTLSSSLYYQHLFDIPVGMATANPVVNSFSLINVSQGYTRIPLANKGSGRNYGFELQLEHRLDKGLFYLLNGSLYESRFTPADGVERNSRFNGNFSTHLTLGKEYRHQKNKLLTLGWSTQLSWSGNQRHTPIDLTLSRDQQREVRPLEGLFSERLPNYFRWDLQLNVRYNSRGSTHSWRLDIQNLINRKNVLGTLYREGAIEEIRAFGLVPVLSYRYDFGR